MAEDQTTEGVITLDAAGRYVDANATALELLGVSLAELLSSTPDRFAIQPTIAAERQAFRAEWDAGGGRPLVGTTGLRRADGTTTRIAYAIEAVKPGYRARLWHVGGSPEAPTSVFSLGDVLREWRAAERVLLELAPDTPDWVRVGSEIELLRRLYQELFRAVNALDH